MSRKLEFNEKNKTELSASEVLSFIDQEKKVTIFLSKGFKEGSDTEDVFRGLVGEEAFENTFEYMEAIHNEGEVQHTFYIGNETVETPFNERGMAKRIIEDNYWTEIILHEHPLKDGCYAMIQNRRDGSMKWFSVNGAIGINGDAENFNKEFFEWVQSKGASFLGVTQTLEEEEGNPELSLYDIVRIKQDNSYAQIEKITSSHGKKTYVLSGDNQEYFEEDLLLVCKCEERSDDWVSL